MWQYEGHIRLGRLTVLFHPVFNTPLWAALAFLPVLVLAGILAFLSGWALAMAAFWTTRIDAVNQTYFTMMFFFSGQLAPLALLPPAFQTIASLLPFRWMLAFPVELLRGQLTPADAASGVMAQVLWTAAAILTVRFLWTEGVKRYTALGG
jgi:ABC-2 type transport system permease protein